MARVAQKKINPIEKVAAAARRMVKGKSAAGRAAFVRHYFSHVPTEDIRDREPGELAALATWHWRLAEKKGATGPAIAVINPNAKRDGWESPRSIVAIVADDMPFLVDSITAELNRHGLTVHLSIHPIFAVTRNGARKIQKVTPPTVGQDAAAAMESFIYLEVTEIHDARLAEIESAVRATVADVRAAVKDWRAMRVKVSALIEDITDLPLTLGGDGGAEARAFMQWVHDDHFTFMGCRNYDVRVGRGGAIKVTMAKGPGLGVLRGRGRTVIRRDEADALSGELGSFVASQDLLLVTKSASVSTVHRPVHMDVIAVKRFDDKGRVMGLRLFVGLFTSVAYNRSTGEIPLLRQKMHAVMDRARFPRGSHNAKALANILETYPRDEMFQTGNDDLYRTTIGILHLQERQRVALFVRRDPFDRFVSCLVFVPRDHYTTDLRLAFQVILESAYGGTVAAHYTQVSDAPLARVQIIVQLRDGVQEVDRERIEAMLAEATRTWADQLDDALVTAKGEQTGQDLFDRYRAAFSSAYKERFSPTTAAADIDLFETIFATDEIGMSLYRGEGAQGAGRLRFKIYHPDGAIPLSTILPMMEAMGLCVLDEVPYRVQPLTGDAIRVMMIHDFGLTTRDGAQVDPAAVGGAFHDAFLRVWRGNMESDGFNGLVLSAGLTWRQVVVLRAIAKFLRQAGIAFSQDYMARTLMNNAALAAKLVRLFEARFDPVAKKGRDGTVKRLHKSVEAGFEDVVSADEDRILRRYLNVIDAMLRTNFYQTDGAGQEKAYVSFKFSSRDIEDLPLPRPLREVFVYSPDVEGVHLRFGLVARGGLRWSDRPEDFRTEVLGLVKAQQVKNAVIVPVGSKGGFVVKRPPTEGGRDAFIAAGINCYKTFICGLLDITDNLVGKGVKRPDRVVCYDDDDPYLVVAADKGTATFSDIANGVAADYGYWLDDAFASGGSVGYDHKKMGITAKGGWESVKRHFRELGLNTQTEPFTAVGVGDMSGDVFGNGMLLSEQTKLIAAFNHLHIFVDPDPDPAKTFKERQRLFNLARSSWTDFDKKAMSKGAVIFDRSAKSLTLTPQIQKRFGLTRDKVTPNALLHAILTADVDLLWFGGIGTYVKAKSESHQDAGDRANDAIRINGDDLNCRVVGEGANLGCTQLGRIDFALKGGRINTDFIDNSAGVDCSDHEVNIKILLQQVRDKTPRALSPNARVKLLESMTDEVGELVLRDNYLQTQAMTLIESQGADDLDNQIRLMRFLERAGRLNRSVEFLPDDETLEERAARKQFMTRPEIAVLMSYAKLWMYDELLQSNLPDDPHLGDDMVTYFPAPLQKKYAVVIGEHRLKREIVATRVTNSLINRTGATFAAQMMETTGMLPSDIARAFMIVRAVFDLPTLWAGIEALDNKVSASRQMQMVHAINQLVERAVLWFLRHGEHPMAVGEHIATFGPGIGTLLQNPDKALPAHYVREMNDRAADAVDDGVPRPLALRIAGMVNLASACDIVELARSRKLSPNVVAKLYYTVGSRFRLGRLRAAAERLIGDSHWQRLAVAAVIEELYAHELALTAQVIDGAGKRVEDADEALAAWATNNQVALDRTETLLSELWSGEINDLAMIAVASRQLSALVQANPQS